MRIDLIEISNFRKLRAVRIDLAEQTTVFVGANNSGKTSAMLALRHFLVPKERDKFTTNDFTASHWQVINKIGAHWEHEAETSKDYDPPLADWLDVLPALDVWLHVEEGEVHRVSGLLPTLEWNGGLLGVRFRFEPKNTWALSRNDPPLLTRTDPPLTLAPIPG